jgi:hypothetical protein
MPDSAKGGRFPGYDVLAKRPTPSWNAQTRRVIDARLAIAPTPKFLTAEEFATLTAIAARIVPQPSTRPPIPVAALVDHKLFCDKTDGYRHSGLPREREAWRLGLRALDAEAQRAHGALFQQLDASQQDALLELMQQGDLHAPEWDGMPPKTFFTQRMAHDIVLAYFSHPTSWNEIGWGGPASPRGYVRMDFDERDPWEAAEVKDGDVENARRKNHRVG